MTALQPCSLTWGSAGGDVAAAGREALPVSVLVGEALELGTQALGGDRGDGGVLVDFVQPHDSVPDLLGKVAVDLDGDAGASIALWPGRCAC